MKKLYIIPFLLLFITFGFSIYQNPKLPLADKNNAGLYLPDGFEALAVVDSLKGAARHLAVNYNGDIYVKTRFHARSGGFGNVALRDTNQDGKADIIKHFSVYESGPFGTAMKIHNGYLYFSSNLMVFRQKLRKGELLPESAIDTLVIDYPPAHIHQGKSIAFDGKGYMYVGWGAGSDVCSDGKPGSKGVGKPDAVIPGEGCPHLIDHGGIFKFDENKKNQVQAQGLRYATGMRSIIGMDWDKTTNSLYAVVHGRDYLHMLWPNLFSPWESAVLPADELFKVDKGIDGGWPYYYYDQIQGKKLLNPEYGGDKIKQGDGAKLAQPIVGFPGHFAPNDLLFYKGNQFPERYKKGAFVVLHGSTIRQPYPQGGYFVAFVPMENGKATGPWEVFADGFIQTDPVLTANAAGYRPMGITEGPDGSLYISETEKGKIWRIMYKGDKTKFDSAQLAKMALRKKTASNIKTPDPVKDNLNLGKPLVASAVYSTYCGTCHQSDGKGDGARFPPLEGSEWVTGDKTRLIKVVLNGLSGSITVKGTPYSENMPAHGSFLNDDQIAEVLSYVRNSWGNKADAVSKEEVAAVRKSGSK
ncbi:c-type cytochrome [Daejeonella sp. H1SJ63]|jgi:glucose/arabinose dehydrogenase|uniref:PQQ-dependent sugar dehydrogenase n=1 Tax=Daejeonella sp. H1SJ63 TaxID=3034145 RepID=UPI0023EB3CB1|nr:c-type cytochrome [Daejeonella sp. H1SJ63]